MFKKHETTEDNAPTSLRPGGDNRPALNTESNGSSMRPAAATTQASIGPSIRIKGDIAGEENIVIHGQVAGSISLPNNTLVVGKEGSLDADVSAKTVEIEGKVSGTVQAADIVRVRASGQVNGDIAAPRVVLEDGCQFRGGIDMQEQKLAGAKPAQNHSKTNGAAAPNHKPKANANNQANA